MQNEKNVLQTRDKARKLAFQNAFFILAKKILEPEEFTKLDEIENIKYSFITITFET